MASICRVGLDLQENLDLKKHTLSRKGERGKCRDLAASGVVERDREDLDEDLAGLRRCHLHVLEQGDASERGLVERNGGGRGRDRGEREGPDLLERRTLQETASRC